MSAAGIAFDVWDTPIGPLGLTVSGGRVTCIAIEAEEQRLMADVEAATGTRPVRDAAQTRVPRASIDRYLAGDTATGRGTGHAVSGDGEELSIPVAITTGTEFQRRVWEALATIPRGVVVSYRWLATKVGNPDAVRAVGQANSRNPLPLVVPCHRVVQADGRLGGYAGDKTAIKAWLLRLEGCPVEEARGTWRVPAAFVRHGTGSEVHTTR